MANYNTSRKKTALYIGLAVILIAFIVINFTGGLKRFRPAPTTASIEITVPSKQTVVYVDNQLVDTTGRDGETVTAKDLQPGNHTIVLSKENYWPWAKIVPVVAGDEIDVRPFMVPSKVSATEVVASDGEYDDAVAKLNAAKAPVSSSVLKSPDGKLAIWVEGDAINAAWQGDDVDRFFCTVDACGKERQIVKSPAPLKAVEFMGDRSDVLIAAAGGMVFAIEIDNKGTQNFQLIYEGEGEPTFAKADNKAIYVRDAGRVFKVSL